MGKGANLFLYYFYNSILKKLYNFLHLLKEVVRGGISDEPLFLILLVYLNLFFKRRKGEYGQQFSILIKKCMGDPKSSRETFVYISILDIPCLMICINICL